MRFLGSMGPRPAPEAGFGDGQLAISCPEGAGDCPVPSRRLDPPRCSRILVACRTDSGSE